MKENKIISKKFLEQYLKIAGLLFNDAVCSKYIKNKAIVEKLENNLYRVLPGDFRDEGIGILDASTFWNVLKKTTIASHFSWDKDAYKIVCAKLN